MIRNCENAKYAHSITKASSSLPRSWKCRGGSTRRSGSRRPRIVSTVIASARPTGLAGHEHQPEDRRVPVRVERHHPVDRREGHREHVEQQPRRADRRGSAACRPVDRHLAAVLRRRPLVEQQRHRSRTRSRRTARPMKNGTFRYGAFNCRIVSPLTRSGPRPQIERRQPEQRSG